MRGSVALCECATQLLQGCSLALLLLLQLPRLFLQPLLLLLVQLELLIGVCLLVRAVYLLLL